MSAERQSLAEVKAAHNHPTYAVMSFVMGCGVQGAGAGSHVADEAGGELLALFDQYGNQSFGYSHERVLAAIREQLDSGRLNSTKIMFERESIRLTERLAELTDGALPFAYLANGGGESIDNALKLARAATGRSGFVTAANCFHGKTFAALSASGRPEHAALFAPFLPGFVQVPFGDVAAMAAAVGPDTAAVLLEPVQAEAGVIVPDPGYLRAVREICDAAGALLILDEMQTAFGRCGTFFAYQSYGVTPDLMCLGKAFGGGVVPLSAVLGTEAVWGSLRELPSTFGSSLGGNPLCARVGLEAIAIAGDPAFLAGVRVKGAVIETRLRELAARFPDLIRAHRGVGMMHGLEFHDESLGGLVLGLLLENRVTSTYSLYNNSVLRVQPPMVISAADLDRGLDILAAVLAEVDRVRADAGSSPVVVETEVPHPAAAVLDALRERPHLLDPFAHDPRAVGPEFAGAIGARRVVWADETTSTGDGVVSRAVPGWLWRRLDRAVSVVPSGPDSCRVSIRVAWDAGTGAYEGLLGGWLGHVVHRTLRRLLADLPTAPHPAPEPQRT
ncbi:MAG TPA: aminotransferase class III-fold pyridoxal phosphate-dependent enzyme [Actinophytocola sp.]|nr:aminotransferase class III-fold pyridoxal phosphate-dependent enzyme [Actinophytocola sp.]